MCIAQLSRPAGLVLLGVAALAAGGCAARSAKPAPVPYAIEEWKFLRYPGSKVTTAHYEIYTTVTDPAQLATMPDLVERAHNLYQQLVPAGHEPAGKMKVYLLATRNQWATMTQHQAGPRAEVFLKIRNGGYSDGGVSVIQFVAPSVTGPLLAHEGFHQYLYCCVDQAVPAWLNEGLAVVCEGQRWTDSGLKEFDAEFNPLRDSKLAEAVNRDRLMPLDELLRTNAGNIVQETSNKVGTYYAQLWALMLFLRQGEKSKYAAGFTNLCAALRSPAELSRRLQAEQIWAEGGPVSPGEALFRSYISDDLPGIEREYKAYLQSRITPPR